MNVGPRVLGLFFCLFLGALSHAQSTSSVFGRVIDPSDAAVPGAIVVVTNQDTGFRRVAQTGPDGTFAVSSLQGGVYKVMVRKEGFVGMIRFDVKIGALQP